MLIAMNLQIYWLNGSWMTGDARRLCEKARNVLRMDASIWKLDSRGSIVRFESFGARLLVGPAIYIAALGTLRS